MKNNGKHAAPANLVEPPADTVGSISRRHAERPTQGQRFRIVALAGLTTVLLGLCAWLAFPFLPGLAWGIAFAIIAWPLHVWIRRRIGNPQVAAIATTLAVLVIIVAPGLYVTYEILREASSAADRMRTEAASVTVRDHLAGVSKLHGVMAWIDSANIDIDTELRRLVVTYVREPSSLLQGSLSALIQFAIALFVLYHFLKDGPILREQIRRMLPMSRSDCDRVFASVSDSVHANIYATVITSLIDAITGGLLFWLVGLPSPVLLGAVIFVVSILPVFGTFVVWIPATIYFLVGNQWWEASLMVGWGVLTAIFVDSLLYVSLAGKRMRLHQVPSMLAFLGGLSLFGPSGMILGPAILAMTVAVLDVWRRHPIPMESERTLMPTSP
jgi:predicted PurR-regulated permease PerM